MRNKQRLLSCSSFHRVTTIAAAAAAADPDPYRTGARRSGRRHSKQPLDGAGIKPSGGKIKRIDILLMTLIRNGYSEAPAASQGLHGLRIMTHNAIRELPHVNGQLLTLQL